jgi:hypothetical protein
MHANPNFLRFEPTHARPTEEVIQRRIGGGETFGVGQRVSLHTISRKKKKEKKERAYHRADGVFKFIGITMRVLLS